MGKLFFWGRKAMDEVEKVIREEVTSLYISIILLFFPLVYGDGLFNITQLKLPIPQMGFAP